MKYCRQIIVILSLIFLLPTACTGTMVQVPARTPTAAPASTQTSAPASTPTTAPANTPTTAPANTPTATPSLPHLLETEDIQGAILTAEQIGADTYWPHSIDPWTPSESDILTMEGRLAGYLKEYYPELWQKLDTYTRQYWGSATPDGSRAIYASFLCDAERLGPYIDWRTDPIEVMDGGDCYFQTLYDVEQDQFAWLMINGES